MIKKESTESKVGRKKRTGAKLGTSSLFALIVGSLFALYPLQAESRLVSAASIAMHCWLSHHYGIRKDCFEV